VRAHTPHCLLAPPPASAPCRVLPPRELAFTATLGDDPAEPAPRSRGCPPPACGHSLRTVTLVCPCQHVPARAVPTQRAPSRPRQRGHARPCSAALFTGGVQGGRDESAGAARQHVSVTDGGVGTATATPSTAVRTTEGSHKSSVEGVGRRRPNAPQHHQPRRCCRAVPTPPTAWTDGGGPPACPPRHRRSRPHGGGAVPRGVHAPPRAAVTGGTGIGKAASGRPPHGRWRPPARGRAPPPAWRGDAGHVGGPANVAGAGGRHPRGATGSCGWAVGARGRGSRRRQRRGPPWRRPGSTPTHPPRQGGEAAATLRLLLQLLQPPTAWLSAAATAAATQRHRNGGGKVQYKTTCGGGPHRASLGRTTGRPGKQRHGHNGGGGMAGTRAGPMGSGGWGHRAGGGGAQPDRAAWGTVAQKQTGG